MIFGVKKHEGTVSHGVICRSSTFFSTDQLPSCSWSEKFGYDMAFQPIRYPRSWDKLALWTHADKFDNHYSVAQEHSGNSKLLVYLCMFIRDRRSESIK